MQFILKDKDITILDNPLLPLRCPTWSWRRLSDASHVCTFLHSCTVGEIIIWRCGEAYPVSRPQSFRKISMGSNNYFPYCKLYISFHQELLSKLCRVTAPQPSFNHHCLQNNNKAWTTLVMKRWRVNNQLITYLWTVNHVGSSLLIKLNLFYYYYILIYIRCRLDMKQHMHYSANTSYSNKFIWK